MVSPLESFVRSERKGGIAGDIADSMFTDKLTFTNDDPRGAQVDTVTIDTATDTEVYSVEIDGVDIPVTAASAVAADIAILLRDAVNAKQLVNGRVVATASGDDLILTARVGGEGFTTVEGSNAAKMSLVNTTANATANTVPFGRMVVANGLSSNDNKLAKLADAADMTAQVQELLLVYDATVIAKVGVEVYDPATGLTSVYEVEHVMATDADTSVIAMAALLNTALPLNTVTVSHPTTDTLTFTSDTAGVGFKLSFGFGTGADTGTWTHTMPTPGDDLASKAVGVTIRDHTQEIPLDSIEAEYDANEAMSVLHRGRIYVDIEAALTDVTNGVFVRLAANGALDKLGGFAPAAGAGLVRFEGAHWIRQVATGLAVLELNL